ncbi:orotate phosphoribosyltransferase [Tepidamorphus gemmatus]|uniref:Orotate phosphoribosyltransferase n=1 Tax=Tepidamorphus gemmatus TaxID=747076 RepID=A0A4R3MER1_9HYPH|nr:orotate phosphoribosyltransferase [Tepidamorphus gemmatus]TCT11513.1 orotate phosphoribosyltransferase [Tepidamorphus gemmatus]
MALEQAAVLEEFRQAGALLEGHFVLSSGRHSAAYLQCARVMMDPRRGERLCAALAGDIRARFEDPFDLVVSPAMGGVIVGYEVARQLGLPAIFVERVDGRFTLRRGFTIPAGARCLMVEDVVTTGLSSRECIAAIREAGGDCAGAACLVDRSGGTADVGVPLVALTVIDIPTYAEGDVPASLAAVPVSKPGSRFLTT